ncbi:MAG TPA: ABC transporter permease subunit [Myxococcaceae bacterium]|nr:ABC transporter permease subunit [Myxococcaceae bacterium]
MTADARPVALPAAPKPRASAVVAAAAVALALAGSIRGSEVDLRALFGADGRRAIAEFLQGFLHPALTAEFLQGLVRPFLETLAIGVAGISLGFLLGFPLSVLATDFTALGSEERGGRGRPAAFIWRSSRWAARLTLNLMRSIPELIWALLFVRAVGLGPLPGVLALGVSYAGVLGKVYSEIYEATPASGYTALRAAGARPLTAFRLALLPPALPLVTSYTLYRFDCALRASAILGLVGAGGIGQYIEQSMKMFAWDEVATLLIALFFLVTLVDALSRLARPWLSGERPGPLFWRTAKRDLSLLGWTAAAAWSFAYLDLSPLAVLAHDARAGIAAFAAQMWPPEISVRLLDGIAPALVETLAVSVLGTALAATAALLLALPAARDLFVRDRQGEYLRPRPLSLAWRWPVHLAARALLTAGRTLPEIVWALVFILAVGLGPFAGALALGAHTAGVLGRLYAEALEEVPREQIGAALGRGATRLQAFLHVVLPQAAPQLVAYTLYRWEVNVRASAVLGIVGAGGIGRMMYIALSLFLAHRALTLILSIVALVWAVEAASGALRRLVLSRGGYQAPSHREAFTAR